MKALVFLTHLPLSPEAKTFFDKPLNQFLIIAGFVVLGLVITAICHREIKKVEFEKET